MGKFTNDLDSYIAIVQHHEMTEALVNKINNDRKDCIIRLSVSLGILATGATLAHTQGNPNIISFSLCTTIIANSLQSIIKNRPRKTDYSIDFNHLDEIDFRALARSHRERDRRKGNLKYQSPSKFHRDKVEIIEEEFGYESDNDLPIHFLKKEDVPERLLREYDLYNLKYELPELTISESNLTTLVNIIEEWLKQFTLSQRIYYYTSQYLATLYAKGLINYWDEISINEFIENLYIFESDDISKDQIKKLKETITEEVINKKNKTLTKQNSI